MEEFDTTQVISKEFPFYHTVYEKGYIKGCVKNCDLTCKECICKTFCLVKGGEDE